MYHEKPTKFVIISIEYIKYIWDALQQKREQVIFWVKWVFDFIVRGTLSALIWYQIQFHIPTVLELTFCM